MIEDLIVFQAQNVLKHCKPLSSSICLKGKIMILHVRDGSLNTWIIVQLSPESFCCC